MADIVQKNKPNKDIQGNVQVAKLGFLIIGGVILMYILAVIMLPLYSR